MPATDYAAAFSPETLADIFPADRADRFFEALFGDAAEGAYDIRLAYSGKSGDRLDFEFQLAQRPGKCLACNLTYGLPEVFSRHPVIDLVGLVKKIDECLPNKKRCGKWRLGRTREISRALHVLPFAVDLV